MACNICHNPTTFFRHKIMSLQLGILLQMSTRDYIAQQIMVNEVIYTRKASIDQFIDGLCALRFFELLVNFSLAFEPLFLASKANTPGIEDVLSLLQLSPDCSSDKDQEIFSMLKDFVKSLNSEGQQTHYIFSNFVVNQNSVAIFTRLSKLPAVLHWFKSPSPHWI